MKFKDNEHKAFYYKMMKQSPVQDSYHKSLYFTLGIDKDCREHINDLFINEDDSINTNGIRKSWQTNGSLQATLLAFNLWNGYTYTKDKKASTPYELFASEYAEYFMEAIRLRYPEYCKEKTISLGKTR